MILINVNILINIFIFVIVIRFFVSKNKSPKFSIFNKMLQIYYQYYSKPLNNFIFIEEIIIAKIYLFITIFKLKLNNNFNLRSYRSIQSHFLFLL